MGRLHQPSQFLGADEGDILGALAANNYDFVIVRDLLQD